MLLGISSSECASIMSKPPGHPGVGKPTYESRESYGSNEQSEALSILARRAATAAVGLPRLSYSYGPHSALTHPRLHHEGLGATPPTPLLSHLLGRAPYMSIPPESSVPLPPPLLQVIPPRAPEIEGQGPMFCLYGPSAYFVRSNPESVQPLHSPASTYAPRHEITVRRTGIPVGLVPVHTVPPPGSVVLLNPHYASTYDQAPRHPYHERTIATQEQAQPAPDATFKSKEPTNNNDPSPASKKSISKTQAMFSGKKKAPPVRSSSPKSTKERNYRKGIKYKNDSFPMKLHRLLLEMERTGQAEQVASFTKDGKSFQIHDKEKFERLLPEYFRHGNFLSFKRLLYMYGFERTEGSWSEGTFHHPEFLRDSPQKCEHMLRKNSTAEKMKRGASPSNESSSSR